jgi:dTDP-4-amino-4,6-dideoxygalactose transaminase
MRQVADPLRQPDQPPQSHRNGWRSKSRTDVTNTLSRQIRSSGTVEKMARVAQLPGGPPGLRRNATANSHISFVDLRAQTRALQPALMAAIEAVLSRGEFVLGEEVERFETEFASYCGVRHAVGVDSGFSALELALRAADIGPGDEVITQANTFIATVGAIMAVGARPVLTDCDEHGGMDPVLVAARISAHTRAIIPVHLFGRIGEIDAIRSLAAKHGLAVIEDACQAHGAALRGRRAGSFGLAGAFSFYPAKNLGAFGDGGMLVTNSSHLAAAARVLRHYGQRVKYEHVATPLNHRLDTMQAAILRVKLPHLDGWNDRRRQLADCYRERLADLPIGLPPAVEGRCHVYHVFVIETNGRDALRASLASAGVETGIHYPIPLHRQPVLQPLGYREGAFPQAERLAARSLSLPMYPELPLGHLEKVATSIRRWFQ